MPDRKYTVVVTEKVRKILLKLSSSVATKIEKKLLELETDPRPSGYKKLKGRRLAIESASVITELFMK